MFQRHDHVPRKTTLFCGACGHQSTVDGDWVRRGGPGEVLVCPECGTVIVAQPDVRPAARSSAA